MTEAGSFEIKWHDAGKEPQCPPNPDYPNGRDIDVSEGAAKSCVVSVQCPAKRIGHYRIRCKICGYSVAVTTAGRPDDPRNITIPCQL